ncbi:uncharacterized protein LOC101740361 isoform X1 [Bombyx mori]|uniref:Peptidase S1 domain-containing protein n=1 Tax=Bombyx mori TaxID=7091 RepID=A0A8R2AKT3_BOMMO|nr:uncharacterized protein LOC101740361 isoform X1 [Bombyx mori]
MNFKIIVTWLVVFQANEISCDCDSYVECLSGFFEDFFFGDPEETEVRAQTFRTNNTEIKNINFSDLDAVLKDITEFLSEEVQSQPQNESDDVFKTVKAETKIYIKAFDFGANGENADGAERKNENFEVVSKIPDRNTKVPINDGTAINAKSKNSDIIEKGSKHVGQNEIFNDELYMTYYDDIDDNSTDYPAIDYAEIYKDVTVEEHVYIPTQEPSIDDFDGNATKSENDNLIENSPDKSRSKSDEESADLNVVSAWIVTVFVKNTTANGQFDYVCDGALISNQHVLTGARCTVHANATFKPDDVIVIVGKKSLQGSGGNEKAVRVTEIHRQDNFTIVNGKVLNELAVLKLDEIVYVNDDVQIANISTGELGDSDKSLTTAWAFSGELKSVYFEKVENGSCADGDLENVLCATYGNEVALCPSYGGLYAVKVENAWFLRGIRSGDPAERGICFIKRIDYTTLDNYLDWINQFLEK